MTKARDLTIRGFGLVPMHEMQAALANAASVYTVLDVATKADTLAHYARQAKDTALLAYATELRVRASRRAGEVLIAQADNGQRMKRGNGRGSQSVPSLKDMGISNQNASAWQMLARLPEDKFEAAVTDALSSVGQVTARYMTVVARQHVAPINGGGARKRDTHAARVTLLAKELAAWLYTGPTLVKPQRDALARLGEAIEEALQRHWHP